MYKLYLTNSNFNHDEDILITEADNINDIFDAIEDWFTQHNIHHSQYNRYWMDGEGVMMDFGSWSKFLYIAGDTSWLMKGVQ